MTILEIVTNKINELKKNSQEEINRITSILEIVNNSIKALEDELKLKDYDFSIAINLVNSNSFGIIDIEKNIKEAKNVLTAKYDYKQTFLSLSLDEKQAIKSFKERLGFLKEELEKTIIEKSKIEIDEDVLESLEDLKNLLEGKGRRKYYTYEMIESLFEIIDYNSFSYDDMKKLVNELGISRNIKGKIEEEKKDFSEVLSLYKEYLGNKCRLDFLNKYQNEICTRIDLVNARSILEFFKEKDLINKFSIISIIQITLYGKYDYVKDFYYEKVLTKDSSIQDIYFEDAMSCVWINEKSTDRRHNTTIRKNRENITNKTLYSTIHEVCDEDVWENIRVLKENESILKEKYDLSNMDYLWVITKPSWLIKKKIELFKTFNFTDITLTSLVQSDLEEKIHFVTELGLLNTPRTYVFREIEKIVPKYNEFKLNGKRKVDTSILNYYPRNTSELGKVSYTEYIYWFYKMQRSSKEEFYQDFFSSYKAGKRNKTDFYSRDDEIIIDNKEAMEKLIDDNFVTNYYDVLIPNFDNYDEVIREYNSSPKGDLINPYFDNNILNLEVLSRLEENVAIDVYSTDGNIRKVNNPYVYLFNNIIISRYKVLRNLSILYSKYGYINDDMILTSVVRGSYINRDTFEMIKNRIRNEGLVK